MGPFPPEKFCFRFVTCWSFLDTAEPIKILLGDSLCEVKPALFIIFLVSCVSPWRLHRRNVSHVFVFSEMGENIIGNTWCVEFFHKLQFQVSSKTKNDIGSP